MHKLIIDLEMADRYSREYKASIKFIHEIIQIGAVLLDDNNNELSRFETFVKPKYSIIRQKITSLTGITEEMVTDAPSIEEALHRLVDFIQDKDNTLLYTWSDNDTSTIMKELDLKGIKNEYISKLCENFQDIQVEFDSMVGFNRQVGLANALDLVGIEFEGRAHGALTDAINTANLYKALCDDESVKTITARIQHTMKAEPLTTSLGSMVDFSQFSFE